MIGALLSFVLWLSIVFLVIRLGRREKDQVKGVELNYSPSDFSDDEMKLMEFQDEQYAQDVLDLLLLEENHPELEELYPE